MKKLYFLICFTSLLAIQAKSQVVINEIYGGGGNSGAPYNQDFVELYNNSATPVVMTNWSIQYSSATGTTWATAANKTIFSGTIAANSYFLIGLGTGVNGIAIPTADATGTTGLSATAGKVVLCNNSTTVSIVVNPTDPQIIDKVGYGPTANGFETAATVAPSNTTSVFRIVTGIDTDNNSADFQAGTPFPQNSAYIPDNTPPTVVSFSPVDDAVNVPTNSILTITFSEAIKKNVGVVSITNATTNTTEYIYIQTSNPNVTVTGAVLTMRGINLQPASSYFITMADSVISDLANNKFAGISNNNTWNFSTDATPPTAVAGILNNTYNLNTAANVFGSDGFKQFSTAGALVWETTTFGNTASNGVQMNGFFGGTNVLNQDWFISPAFDLTATTFPLLSFNSITKFNGTPLQLKVSTNYPGYGNPNNFTWTNLNGKFPAQNSNVWTLSNNINLSAYKSIATYFAFVYNSEDDDGQRWTLDDVRIDNSPTAPPASLTLSTTNIQFGYVASGGTLQKTFNITGNDITGDIVLTASAGFNLSTDGVTFLPSITLLQAASNNISRTIYVQFSPAQNNINYNGTISVATPGVTTPNMLIKGTSIDPVKTLEVVNWNVEWFGSPTLGPTNDGVQEQNVRTIMQNVNADVYALVEVVDEARLANVVSQMPGYAYVICNYGSYVNPPNPTGNPLSTLQKEAFVYKTSVVSNVTTRPLINNQNFSSSSYFNWAGGRYPYLMTADVTLDGITKNIDFVLIHAKANTAPTVTSYNRRKAAADELHDTLNLYFGTRNIILLGDFNDDLDVTIADGVVPNTTSYSSFTGDPANFFSPTLALSLANYASTVSYSDMIDHVYLSNEMQAYYMNGTSNVLNDVAANISSYGTTTSDHYPIFTRYAFDPAILPVKLSSFIVQKIDNNSRISWTTEQEVNSSHFVIERSTDGRVWNSIATVAAQGNSTQKINYEFYDKTPARGINYYRLKIIDKDGKTDYTVVRSTLFNSNTAVEIAPNPASNFINLYITKNNRAAATIQLLDATGKIVYNTISAQSHIQISTNAIKKGLYFVKVINTNETTLLKVMVQ